MSRPMSASKVAARNLRKRLDIDYIMNRCSVFKSDIGDHPFDERTAHRIEQKFTLWFNSWVKSDLEKVLTKILDK